MPIESVGQAEMEALFAVTDAMGIHRESIVVPLRPRTPGGVKRKPTGQFEITLDASADLAEWLKGLPALLRAAGHS